MEEPFLRHNGPALTSNGWGDYIGIANMTSAQLAYFIAAARRHRAGIGPRPPDSENPVRGARRVGANIAFS